MTLPPTQPVSRRGCVVAAPHSGAGKTLVTLALLRALTRAGTAVKSAKVGPDYIDPAFHAVATGRPCMNLDLWAMGEAEVIARAGTDDFLLVEGVMGLFDGADDGTGSTAHLALTLDLPVILVVDARAQSMSAAALLHGFKTFRPEVVIAGVIFNRVGSPRHEGLLRRAAGEAGVEVLGYLSHQPDLSLPARHLGLVQAVEHNGLDDLIDKAADWVESAVDISRLISGAPLVRSAQPMANGLPPLGQRIAVARDRAFAFAYPHLLHDWQAAGAEILLFSPLADEAPDERADAIFLPGGYPELHAGELASNPNFVAGLRARAQTALTYGECGGFMVLGDALIDAEGRSHKMTGLLPVTTSFKDRKRHLGYRHLTHESPLPWPKNLRGHEFHYSVEVTRGEGTPLFAARATMGDNLPPMGLQNGRVLGSYAHVIAADWSEP